uniref:Dynein attachment factor N-terminal domain-containing protein n=1 Tax=Oryzias latipes TaxID=8090 RepID=A0A3P9I5B8_ORYLA
MSQRDVIDFSALERELKAAVESDRRYDRANEAKLRAVHQGVSYEQFRNLVLSSHLKPLEKKDTDGAPRKQPWNPVTQSESTIKEVEVSRSGKMTSLCIFFSFCMIKHKHIIFL